MIDIPTLDVMAAAYAAVVAERQIAFERLTSAEIWTADLDERRLQIGDRTFEVSFLGSAADAEDTWLWGWANAAFGLKHVATAPVAELVAVGHKYDVPELTAPSVPLSSLANPGIQGPFRSRSRPSVHLCAVQVHGLVKVRHQLRTCAIGDDDAQTCRQRYSRVQPA